MIKKILICGLTAMATFAMADEKRVETRVVEKDGIRLKVGGSDGYSITVDGAPFSAVSRLFVVNPAWSERYYGYNDDKRRVSDARTTGLSPGAEGLQYNLMSGRSDTVEGTQTLEILPGHRLRIATELRMTSDTRGIVENRVASIGEGWLTNTQWSAILKDDSTSSGITPRWAPGTQPSETTLLKDFQKATFQTPRGPLTMETSGTTSIALLDYRRNQWAEGQQYYWLGVLGSDLPGQDILRYEVVFTFPRRAEAQSHAAKTALQVSAADSVVQVPAPEDRIIPTPKKITWGDGLLAIPAEITYNIQTARRSATAAFAGPVPADIDAVIAGYTQRLKEKYGITLKPSSAENAIITFGHTPADSETKAAIGHPEGYSITVAEDEVFVGDLNTTAGVLNALRSLEQLIRFDETGKPGLRHVAITDWPSMPFRGIHFFTGKDARDLQVKMVSDILAPLKINNLVYQIDYVKWASQPQIHSDLLSMDKDDAIAVGESARQQGIDVIPLVNTFGHSEWLLQRPEMRYLADDPEDPYAYDPSNPEVYEIAEEIYREAIAMFNPTIMHIGHDEVHLDGFPKKPENKAVGATQLFINDTKHYYNFLKNLGIRTMMWGDMLLGPGEAPDAALAPTVEEAKRRRSLLPKDIIIADWHYKSAPVEEYKSPAIFNREGFDAIGCTWYSADNITRFAKAMAGNRESTTKSLGLMQTTWAGYSFDETSLVENLDQYAAYVLAAEAAWTGGYTDSNDVPFDYHEEFLRRWNGELVSGGDKPGWIASLDSVATRALSAPELSLADTAFDGLKPGNIRMGKYTFNLAATGDKPAVATLQGAWDKHQPSTTASLTLQAESLVATSEMFLALATPYWVPDGTRVGTLTVSLEDASTQSLPLVYGKNTMSISDGRQTLVAPIAWRSEETELSQGGAAVHVLRWQNQNSGKKVKAVTLEADPSGPGLMVFGISGI